MVNEWVTLIIALATHETKKMKTFNGNTHSKTTKTISLYSVNTYHLAIIINMSITSTANTITMDAHNTTNMLNVATQLESVRFSQRSIRSKRNANGLMFDVQLSGRNPAGRNPCCMVRNARLGVNGRMTDNARGIKVIEYVLDGKTGACGTMTKLALAFNRTDHEDIRMMCKGVFAKWMERHDPVRKSMWYQNNFPDLTDGTKVYSATRALVDPELFVDQEFEGAEQYEGPSRTFGDFLYGEEEDSKPWYASLRVSEGFVATDLRPATDYVVAFFDEKGKPCTDKVESEMTVYKKGGVPLMSPKMLKVLTESEFYKTNFWVCSTIMQLYALEIKCACIGPGQYCLYPVFQFRTNNSLCFRIKPMDAVVDGITYEQRDAIFSAAIFEGVNGPTKKRKRSTTVRRVKAALVDDVSVKSEDVVTEPISVEA